MNHEPSSFLSPRHVQALAAAAPASSVSRGKALSIDKHCETLRKQLTACIGTIAQVDVLIRNGQQMDQDTVVNLHGLMVGLHLQVDALAHLNVGKLPDVVRGADGSHKGPNGARPVVDHEARSAAVVETDDGDSIFTEGPSGAPGEGTVPEEKPGNKERSREGEDRRQQTRARQTPAGQPGGSAGSAGAGKAGSASAAAAGPSVSVPQGPAPVPFRLYTPAPPPPAQRWSFAHLKPVEGMVAGSIACAPSDKKPAQSAVIGMYDSGPDTTPWCLALNLDEPFALGAFGAPGGGKTYFKGVVVESFLQDMAMCHLDPGLAQPGCVLALRVGEGPEIALDHMAAVSPNQVRAQGADLWCYYEMETQGLEDLVILCLPEDVAPYRAKYPFAMVLPIQLALRSLSAMGFNALMGVYKGRSPLYMRELGKSLRALRSRGAATLPELRAAVADLGLSSEVKKLVQHRLDLIEPFMDESVDLRSLLRPGRLIQIAISTAGLLPEDARLLAALLLDTLVLQDGGERCPLLLDLDEAHTLMDDSLLEQTVETVLRRRRHLRTGVILCTHSPKALKKQHLALLDSVALFRHDDLDSMKHLGEGLSIFRSLGVDKCAALPDGYAWFWAARYYPIDKNPKSIMSGDVISLLKIRPRASHHGGATRRAVEDPPGSR